jgi:hypothetical protein
MKFINCTTGQAGEFHQVNLEMVLFMTRLKTDMTRLTFVSGETLDVVETASDILCQLEDAREPRASTRQAA